MKRLRIPTHEEDWRQLASAIIKANLKLAGMNYVDLSVALRTAGVDDPAKNISSKMVRGTFSAAFFLQSLTVIGVEELTLPTSDDRARDPRA